MSKIEVSNLTFAYEGYYDNVFKDVSFVLDTDWKLGVIGRNGRGKSTLFHLLSDELTGYTGSIIKSVHADYFPYPVEDIDQWTIHIVESMDKDIEIWKVCRELNMMYVDEEVLYRPFSTLSHGEQTKVMLAVLFARENHFLLIDEPTNHLDMESRRILMAYLAKKRGFMLVSHDRAFMDGCVDHVLAINRVDITVTKGNFSVWWANKQNQDEYECWQNEKLKKDIRRYKQAARQTADWSDKVEKTKFGSKNSGLKVDRGYIGHKSAKMMKRAKTIEQRALNAADAAEGLLKNIEKADSLKLQTAAYPKQILAKFQDVSLDYSGKKIIRHFNLAIHRGERVALQGRNGCGKSSIIKLLVGELLPSEGIVHVGSGLVISYLPQDMNWLAGSLDDFINKSGVDATLMKTILRKLDFSREQFEKNMRDYSAGQKKKVLLARSICEKAHIYVWDEPLNFIDVFSRIQIEDLLKQYQPTMLFVEHDAAFIQHIATKILTL